MTSTHSRARRAGFAAFVGTTIEWYDVYVYATAAALVFGPLFFPSDDPLAETAAAFATFAIAFLVRPFGGILFGHIGDKLGRRVSLVITLLLMGVATVLVGCLPTYETIGIMAPILLILLRALQGLAVGGEWGGAVLMSVEHAPEKSKTFYGGFTQLGNPAGALLASGIFAIMSRFGDDFIINGGWRIPFLLSIVLIGVGLWVRYRVEESPVFEQKIEGRQQSMPLAFALRNNWKPILLGIGLLPISTGGYYLATTFATAYATGAPISISARRPGLRVPASARSPSRTSRRFSPTSGTTSATVASATRSRSSSAARGSCPAAPSSACASLNATAVAHSSGHG